jgi:hypothetical protein
MRARSGWEPSWASLGQKPISGRVGLSSTTDLRVRTVQQLRAGTPPNPWETAWIVWHATDDRHLSYLMLEPNGWELGQARARLAGGGQRFLASDYGGQ